MKKYPARPTKFSSSRDRWTMGVEFSREGTAWGDFPEPSRFPRSRFNSSSAGSVRHAHRPPDQRSSDGFAAISDMLVLANMTRNLNRGNPAILMLSDGVTAHSVSLVGTAKGPDDYLLIYQDPWPDECGSFLETGKNVAGSPRIATRRRLGLGSSPPRNFSGYSIRQSSLDHQVSTMSELRIRPLTRNNGIYVRVDGLGQVFRFRLGSGR